MGYFGCVLSAVAFGCAAGVWVKLWRIVEGGRDAD